MSHDPFDPARGGIEFLDGAPDPSPDEDEVVELGRRLPRWAVGLVGVVAGLAAIALVTTLVTRSNSHPTTSSAGPTDSALALSPVPSSVPVAPTPVPLTGRVGPALDLPQDPAAIADAVAAVAGSTALYVVRRAQLNAIGPPPADATRSVPLTGSLAITSGASERLLLDQDSHRLWLAAAGSKSTRLLEFDSDTLRPLRSVTVAGRVADAAVLAGHLYLATPTGLDDLAPGATSTKRLTSVIGPVSAVAADPTRHRVLGVQDAIGTDNDSVPATLFAVTPGTSGRPSRTVQHDLGNLSGASFAIVHRQIWVGGVEAGQSGIGSAEIARLDPVTLETVQTDAVALQVAKVVLTAGASDIWVSGPRPGLWCLNPVTGEILEHWTSVRIPVASRVGSAVVVDAGAVRPLVLDACSG